MKKSDLKTGMRVRVRNGEIYLVIKDVEHAYGHEELAFVSTAGFMKGSNYNNVLINTIRTSGNYDVMEVFNINGKPNSLLSSLFLDLDKRVSIWKRQEYTDKQKEVFKALKVLGFNYVARDECNDLYAFTRKPVKRFIYKNWNVEDVYNSDYIELTGNNEKVFDFVKWEDEEPFEIPTL